MFRLREANVRMVSAVVAVTFLSLLGCQDLSEAAFELGTESRLPTWFTLPQGLPRSDVTVRVAYYVTPTRRTAKVTLLDAKKQSLAEANGTMRGFEPIMLKHSPTGFPSGYPKYEIVTVDGKTEVIEHRRAEPIFYINDDPAVRAELETIIGSGKAG